jgi:hypothetical protein
MNFLPHLTVRTGDLWEDAHDGTDQMKEPHGDEKHKARTALGQQWGCEREVQKSSEDEVESVWSVCLLATRQSVDERARLKTRTLHALNA